MSDREVSMLGSLEPWKGVSPYCEALYEGLQREGVDIEFFNWRSLYPEMLYPGGDPKKGDKYYQEENVRTVLQWWNPISWIYVGMVADGEVLHAQWWSHVLAPAYFTVLGIAMLRGLETVITVHNVKPHEQSRIANLLNRSIYPLGDSFIVHSEANRTALSREYGIDESDISVIPHPPIQFNDLGLTRESARENLDIDQDANLILFFGNIREYKGLDLLLESVPDIDQQIDSLRVIVAGKPWNGFEQYQDIIEQEEIGDIVLAQPEYIGDDRRIETLFRASDLIVLPYTHFGAQSGIPEIAHHFDVPVVGTDVGGLGNQVDYVTNLDNLADDLVNLLKEGNLGLEGQGEDPINMTAELYDRFLND